jgi:ribonuclease P protein component
VRAASGSWLAAGDVERRLRLREESEVRATRAQGKAYADGPLVARVRPSDLVPPQNRYTVVAGKRVGKAVHRNRVKRLVREALRHLHPSLRPGHDIVVIVRGTTDELPDLDTAATSLNRIVNRARLLKPSAVSHQPSVPVGSDDSGREQSDPSSSLVQQNNRLLTADD